MSQQYLRNEYQYHDALIEYSHKMSCGAILEFSLTVVDEGKKKHKI